MVFSEKGARLRLELDEGLGIYSASLNRSDWLAVTAQKKSQKGCVTVYNADMDKVFEFDSAARFVIGAYVTEDCRYMVAQTLGQEDGVFVSEMVVYRLDQEEQYAEFAVTRYLRVFHRLHRRADPLHCGQSGRPGLSRRRGRRGL